MDQFIEALELRADFYVVMLGTNDAKTQIFDENEFLNSYSEMLKILKSIVDLKNIYVMIPPPVTEQANKLFGINVYNVNDILPQILPPFFAKNGIL